MDEHYKEVRHHAADYENQIKNLLDDKSDPIGRGLLEKSRLLVSEVEAKRKPRQLENRIKEILHLLHEAKEMGEAIMDQRHISFLHHSYEHLGLQLRKFDNY